MGIIRTLLDNLALRRRVGDLERQMRDLRDQLATVELDATSAIAQVRKLRGRVTGGQRKEETPENGKMSRHDRLRAHWGVPKP
jgi:phage shock protein A